MQLNSHKVPFFNKKVDLKAGLNQLGLRNASEALFTSLLTGLNNVSNRIRYYSFYCWLVGEFYKNRKVLQIRNSINISAILSTYWFLFIPEDGKNGRYPPTPNWDIRSLLVPLNRLGTRIKVPIFTLSKDAVRKAFCFFGDDRLYIYNDADIVKYSWNDCR